MLGGHQRACSDDVPVLAAAAADLRAHVARRRPGEQQPAQHRPELLRVELGAGAGGDRLGGGVRLLGGDAALLERAGRRVARRVDVVLAAHEAAEVDRDEPVLVVREAGDLRPGQARQAHHALGGQTARRGQAQLAVAELAGVAARVERHAALLQQLAQRRRGRRAEELERRGLGGHQRQLDLAQAAFGHPRRRHQRQLVQRQRPGRTGRHREDDAADAALLELAQHGAKATRVAGPCTVTLPAIETAGRAPTATSRMS